MIRTVPGIKISSRGFFDFSQTNCTILNDFQSFNSFMEG